MSFKKLPKCSTNISDILSHQNFSSDNDKLLNFILFPISFIFISGWILISLCLTKTSCRHK